MNPVDNNVLPPLASPRRDYGRRFSRVLVPIDRSQPYAGAIAVGAAIAGHVFVVHAVEFYIGMAGTFPLEPVADLERLVDAAAFEARLHGVSATATLLPGGVQAVAPRILQAAKEWDAQAIVLGSRRARGLRRVSGRRTREQIVRGCNLPVIIVPAWPLRASAQMAPTGEAALSPSQRKCRADKWT